MTAPKVRIYDVYKSLGLDSSKDLMTILDEQFGVEVKSHSSMIDQSLVDKVAKFLKGGKAAKTEKAPAAKTSGKSAGAKTAAKTEKAPAAKPPAKSAPAKTAKKETAAPAAKAEKAPAAKSPEPAKPAAAPDEDDEPPPRIDPSRVRVIKRQPQPETPPPSEEPVAEAPKPPTIIERKTPVVESKRYLIDGTPPPAPAPVSNLPKPGTIISSPDSPRGSHKPGQAGNASRPAASAAGTATLPERRTDTPARPGDPAAPAAEAKPQVVSTYTAPDADKYKGRSFVDRSWPQERLAALNPQAKKPKRSKQQQKYLERQEQIKAQQELELERATAQKLISIPGPITVSELAEGLWLKETELIKHLFMKGVMVTVTQTLETDYARAIAKELEFEIQEELDEQAKAGKPETQYETIDTDKKKLDEATFKHLAPRAPVVSIMGHVDHGKTTLLDSIRETRHKVVDDEAGGITQSIGAYTVEKNGHQIVFLDTPGHEAFTAMRMRGARSTDIAILVVAADDGVMPQTIEAINHAKAAQIPIIVAVNKIDKEGADPDLVLGQLTEYGLTSEKWGGETLTNEVSALQKEGLDALLDNILLVSELLDLKADATVPGTGVIVEAQLDKRMGPVATALVQNGTLRVGDNVLMGSVGGRVRALISDSGERVQSAGPSTPVEILGLDSVPNAGEAFEVITDDRQFKQRLQTAKIQEREDRLNANRTRMMVTPGFAAGVAVAEGMQASNEPQQKQFNVVVKADTQGAVEAVVDVVRGLSTEEIKVNVLHSGTGDITEADIMLAGTGNALVIAFNVKEDGNVPGLAKQHGLLIKQYDVIYHIAEDVEKMMLGKLSPDIEESEAGQAEVRQVFKVGKAQIAGCMVTSGKIVRNAKAIISRDGQEIFTGTIDNLKRFKDDAKEVASGYECGISFDKFNDFETGDVITVYTIKEVERKSL